MSSSGDSARAPGFDEFVSARLPALLRYAAVVTGDRDLAQDIVQETLIRAHRKWKRISQVGYPELYLKRMVVNEFLSWRRRWQVRNVMLARQQEPGHEPALGLTPDPAIASGERDEARARLATLPPRQRAVLVLRFYEGFSDTEIAEILGCTPGTVRGYASRALAALRLQAHAAPACHGREYGREYSNGQEHSR